MTASFEGRYDVYVADRTGEFWRKPDLEWWKARLVMKDRADVNRGRRVVIGIECPDRCDVDCPDGLTKEEREAL